MMKTALRLTAAAALLLSASTGHTHDDDRIETGSDMALWCKDISYDYFRSTAKRVSNWRHTTLRKGEEYVVRGKWKVDGSDVAIECAARAGSSERYARFRIVE